MLFLIQLSTNELPSPLSVHLPPLAWFTSFTPLLIFLYNTLAISNLRTRKFSVCFLSREAPGLRLGLVLGLGLELELGLELGSGLGLELELGLGLGHEKK